MNANCHWAKVSQNFHVGRVCVPNFQVKEQNENEHFEDVIGAIETFSEKEFELVEYPAYQLDDRHHEEERLEHIIDKESMAFRNVIEEVELDFVDNVLPKTHYECLDRCKDKSYYENYKSKY